MKEGNVSEGANETLSDIPKAVTQRFVEDLEGLQIEGGNPGGSRSLSYPPFLKEILHDVRRCYC